MHLLKLKTGFTDTMPPICSITSGKQQTTLGEWLVCSKFVIAIEHTYYKFYVEKECTGSHVEHHM